jgi:hypothetical protein
MNIRSLIFGILFIPYVQAQVQITGPTIIQGGGGGAVNPFPGCISTSVGGQGIFCPGQFTSGNGFVATSGGNLYFQSGDTGISGPWGIQNTTTPGWQVIRDNIADQGGWNFAIADSSTKGFQFYKGQPVANGGSLSNLLMLLDPSGSLMVKNNITTTGGNFIIGDDGGELIGPYSNSGNLQILSDDVNQSGGWTFGVTSTSTAGWRFFVGASPPTTLIPPLQGSEVARLDPNGNLYIKGTLSQSGTGGFTNGNNINGWWVKDPVNHIHQWGITPTFGGSGYGTTVITFPTSFTTQLSVRIQYTPTSCDSNTNCSGLGSASNIYTCWTTGLITSGSNIIGANISWSSSNTVTSPASCVWTADGY